MPSGSFGDVAEKLRRSTVQVVSGSRRSPGSGSGVICGPGDMIVTNAHVAREPVVQIELWDGRSFPADVTSRDVRTDLAKLKVNAAGLPALSWRAAPSARPGELAIAVGNPLGFVGALSTGVVHAFGRVPGMGARPWIQAAIRLAPGNSGGPLADAEGRVIGINTAVVAGGLALAIPSDSVLAFLQRGARPALGIAVRPVALSPSGSIGLLVLEVVSQSLAENASLLIGDLLVAANTQSFQSADDLGDAIDRSEGSVLKLRFLRGDRRNEREVSIPLPQSRREAA
jgi:serine protease Do